MQNLTLNRQIPIDDSWDVIIVGGGPAGSAAAVASVREGARTLLIERCGALGGMGTLGLVPWFCGYTDGKRIISRGIAEHILNVCRENTPHQRKSMDDDSIIKRLRVPSIDPELLKRVYDDIVINAGVEILFHTHLAAVEKNTADTVEAIIVASKAGLTALKAKVYVDCTGDGDLAAWAEASFEKGDKYGNMQPATHCFIITNIDEYAINNGPGIHFFDPLSPIHKAVASDKYPLISELHSCSMHIGPGTYGFNMGHVFDMDNTNPVAVSKAMILGRKMAIQYRDAFAEYHPAFANSFLVETGELIGARESRRITGDYVLNLNDYLERRSFDDEICRCAYEIDIHWAKHEAAAQIGRNIDDIKSTIEKQIMQYKNGESFGVPYRCLTPRDLKNVIVAGRCISTDRSVNGSVRIMTCCLNTGEAAGVAAAIAAATESDVHIVNVKEIRKKLQEYGAYLPE